MACSRSTPGCWLSAVVSAWIVLCAGCGGVEVFEIQGQVTLDGQPLGHGSIRFQPIDGKGQSVGAKIENGRYTAIVSRGPKHVVISSQKSVDTGQLYPAGPVVEKYEEQLPAIYNRKSKLSARITPKKTQYDFKLISRKSVSPTLEPEI